MMQSAEEGRCSIYAMLRNHTADRLVVEHGGLDLLVPSVLLAVLGKNTAEDT